MWSNLLGFTLNPVLVLYNALSLLQLLILENY
jgi:hypothetical protein